MVTAMPEEKHKLPRAQTAMPVLHIHLKTATHKATKPDPNGMEPGGATDGLQQRAHAAMPTATRPCDRLYSTALAVHAGARFSPRFQPEGGHMLLVSPAQHQPLGRLFHLPPYVHLGGAWREVPAVETTPAI